MITTQIPMPESECWSFTCFSSFPAVISENEILTYFSAFLYRFLQLIYKYGKLMPLFWIRAISSLYVVQWCNTGDQYFHSCCCLSFTKSKWFKQGYVPLLWKTENPENKWICQHQRASWYQNQDKNSGGSIPSPYHDFFLPWCLGCERYWKTRFMSSWSSRSELISGVHVWLHVFDLWLTCWIIFSVSWVSVWCLVYFQKTTQDGWLVIKKIYSSNPKTAVQHETKSSLSRVLAMWLPV